MYTIISFLFSHEKNLSIYVSQIGIKIDLKVRTSLKDPQDNISGYLGDLACICCEEEINNASVNQRPGQPS
jgi:hypothetical protein